VDQTQVGTFLPSPERDDRDQIRSENDEEDG